MNSLSYWKECIQDAADECGLNISAEQISSIADSVRIAHENYDMAFYRPPSTDRISVLEEEKRIAVRQKEDELLRYQMLAEKCIKKSMGLRQDEIISIQDDGSVRVER